ncbi:glycosyltransferase [Salinimicrobium sp. TH3]|uniref:glycosyltransferase n=1 Tax=Salinimicrobium sp. TH3 TaxID=2997342 RepID=UPI0022731293|nr:glycosyltransferase [Salinimicrobium sp. TH3]MCY2687795.1 glycosyltransferase [Salinimicrobium sp. TH3]
MTRKRLKIFVSAYACEPNLGSEIGVGWHWVLEMSKYFDLWVLTRKSNQANIESWIKNNPEYNSIKFLYFDLPYYLRFWKKGLRGVRTYYLLWQKLTNSLVKRTMEENDIEIYHLLTYGNALWPVSSYGKKKFFIWGPTGVGDTIPKEFSKHYEVKSKIIESVRRFSVKTLPLNSGFKNRCANANLIFCKTETASKSIPIQYRNKALVFTDVAVERIEGAQNEQKIRTGKIIQYLAVGRLDAWRGFDLLIEAFAQAVKNNQNIHLEILGKGSDKQRLDKLVNKFKLERFVTLSGQVSQEVYYEKMAYCDVVVNPSLKEGAVTTAFDSMSFSKPLICVNTGGYTRYFNEEYAVVIPRTTRSEVIQNLSIGILELSDPMMRKVKGEKANEIGGHFDWQKKGELIFKEITRKYSEFQRNLS